MSRLNLWPNMADYAACELHSQATPKCSPTLLMYTSPPQPYGEPNSVSPQIHRINYLDVATSLAMITGLETVTGVYRGSCY